MRSQGRAAALAAICSLLVVAGGCGASTVTPAPSATPTGTEPTPAATATTTPTIMPPPTLVPTPETALPTFACDRTLRAPGSVPRAQIAGLQVTNEGGVGRISFTFLPEGNVAAVPEIEVRPADPPFTLDPSGLPLDVPGAGHVVVTLMGGTALDEDFEPTFEGPFDFDPAGEPIVAFRRAGDFEAISSFVVGLSGNACVRILPPDGTSRLVIEIVPE